jgi:hypothetical protein
MRSGGSRLLTGHHTNTKVSLASSPAFSNAHTVTGADEKAETVMREKTRTRRAIFHGHAVNSRSGRWHAGEGPQEDDGQGRGRSALSCLSPETEGSGNRLRAHYARPDESYG